MITLINCKEVLTDPANCPIGYLLGSKKYFEVLQNMQVQLSNNQIVEIPKGFKTDLSSVPRWLWSVDASYGDFLFAALIHDFLYVNNIGSRKEADREMLLWSVLLNDNQLDNYTRYAAVRIFGRKWWEHKVNYNNQNK